MSAEEVMPVQLVELLYLMSGDMGHHPVMIALTTRAARMRLKPASNFADR